MSQSPDFYVNHFYNLLLEHLDEGVYYVDENRKILYWNKKAEEITGYRKKEVEGCLCHDNLLQHVDEQGRNLCHSHCPLLQSVQTKDPHRDTIFLHHKEGHRIPVYVRIVPIVASDGMCIGAVEVFSDSSQKNAELEKIKELTKLAFVDSETSLPNQNYLLMKLRSLTEDNKKTQFTYGAIMIALDNFGEIEHRWNRDMAVKALNSFKKTVLGMMKINYVLGRWNENNLLCIVPFPVPDNLEWLAQQLVRIANQSTMQSGRTCIRLTAKSKCMIYLPGQNLEGWVKIFVESKYMTTA